jgi:pyrroloquinoline quinone (PQQ) biosynthesis protein C
MYDHTDHHFAHLVGELDADQIAVAAVQGAAYDLAADLERALVWLHEREHHAVGHEAEEVQLEINMAKHALRKLNRVFDSLDAIETARARRVG